MDEHYSSVKKVWDRTKSKHKGYSDTKVTNLVIQKLVKNKGHIIRVRNK